MNAKTLRDAVILTAVAVVLGTLVNLLPARHLPWWGQGAQPPTLGVDFQWIDPLHAEEYRLALPSVVFLDTRDAATIAAGAVPGAEPLSYTEVAAELTEELETRLRAADAVILYGDSDDSDIEQLLAQELHRRGLQPPSVMVGGFPAWQASGLPVSEGGQ